MVRKATILSKLSQNEMNAGMKGKMALQPSSTSFLHIVISSA